MPFKIAIAALSAALMTGCASVNMVNQEESSNAKAFAAPSAGNAGLYVYRNSPLGHWFRMELHVDRECLGKSAPDVFFYKQVAGGKKHSIETESEFSPNTLEVFTEAGKNYFVRQYIRIGLIFGPGADLELVSEEQGKADVAKLAMAQPGTCGK